MQTVKIRCMGWSQFNEAYLITNLSRQYSLMTNRKSIAWKNEHQKVIGSLTINEKKDSQKSRVEYSQIQATKRKGTVKSSDLPPGRVWRFVFGISPRACFCWQLTLNGSRFHSRALFEIYLIFIYSAEKTRRKILRSWKTQSAKARIWMLFASRKASSSRNMEIWKRNA